MSLWQLRHIVWKKHQSDLWYISLDDYALEAWERMRFGGVQWM